MMNMMLELLG